MIAGIVSTAADSPRNGLSVANLISVPFRAKFDLPLLDLPLLVAAIALTRFAFRSHMLYDIDSVNFALAIDRFDPRVYQPHPPAYFLYIWLGRLLNFVAQDANLALVALSVLASCGVVYLIYRLATEWHDRQTALFASLLFVFSPLAWFHGTVALTYSVETFFSALLGYFCWQIHRGRTVLLFPAALTLGISAGVRPSSLLLLGPLFLFSLLAVPVRNALLAIALLGLTVVGWFLPMLQASGGPSAYFGALFSLWKLVPSTGAVWNSSPVTSIARALTIAFIYLLCFGPAGILALIGRPKLNPAAAPGPGRRAQKRFLLAWSLPALCFFTLVFLKFVNSGYLLLLSPPACLCLGWAVSRWHNRTRLPKSLRFAVLGACALTNTLIFLAWPAYCSYRSVRQFEAELNAVRSAIVRSGPPDQTLIVAFDSHFLGYRHAGYYLPGYVTLQYPEVKLIEGTRIFAMHGRDTALLAGLPTAVYTKFVLCPLPREDSANKQYLEKVLKLLPSQDLREQEIDGERVISAPIRDLPLLFPTTAAAPRQDVYALLHSRPGL